jgi:hypothetical protein
MDTTILSGMAGVFGSLVGGSATVATAWITQRTLNRRRLVAAEIRNRQNLYGEFINECSARALDSFENTLDKSERLLSIYALLNRIRICASDTVLSEAERALASITEQYFSPNLPLDQLRLGARRRQVGSASLIRGSVPRGSQIDAHRVLVVLGRSGEKPPIVWIGRWISFRPRAVRAGLAFVEPAQAIEVTEKFVSAVDEVNDHFGAILNLVVAPSKAVVLPRSEVSVKA